MNNNLNENYKSMTEKDKLFKLKNFILLIQRIIMKICKNQNLLN